MEQDIVTVYGPKQVMKSPCLKVIKWFCLKSAVVSKQDTLTYLLMVYKKMAVVGHLLSVQLNFSVKVHCSL